MSPFKRPDKAEPDGSDEDRESDGEKPSKRPEGKRRDGQRKLQAALDRVDEKGAKKDRAKRKGDTTTHKTDQKKRDKPRKRKRSADDRPSLRQRARSAARVARTASASLAIAIVTILAAGAAIVFALLGRVLALVLRAWLRLRPPVRTISNRVRSLTFAASKLVTPKRVLALVVAAAAILLVLSQYADYRSVAIGTDAYSGLEAIAPPPEVERAEAGEPHAYLFVPIGIVCLGLLVLVLRGRAGAGRLIAVAGVAAILVALLVDRPAGLDISTATMSFEGVEARLLGGFYAQIAAGLVLAVAALMLSRTVAGEAPARSKRKPETSTDSPRERTGSIRSAEA